MALSDEKTWFNANRATIASQYQGQWVLVRDKAVRGAYPSYEQAYGAGVAQFGPQGGFLIQQALLQDPLREIV
jgi:hypothetical protein